MWAGRTRCPTAGSFSTGPRWATSGKLRALLPWTEREVHRPLYKPEPPLSQAVPTSDGPQGRAPRREVG